jgi:hypothetical protein
VQSRLIVVHLLLLLGSLAARFLFTGKEGMKRICSIAALAVASAHSFAIINGVDAPDFTFVGSVNGASGVVVGSNWVLTATHVGGGPFTLNGTTYIPDTIINADGLSGRPLTDLTLMHFSTAFSSWSDPYYGAVTGQTMTIVGFGGGGTLRPDGTGFNQDLPGGTRRKGVNVASVVTTENLPWLGNAPVQVIEFDIDGNGIDTFGDGGPILNGNTNLEATYAGGDSGGGAFLNISGVWRLVGTNDFIFDANNPPNGNNWDFGDGGGAIHLGAYQNWIESTIHPVPEPASLAALGIGALALLRRRRAR